MGDRNRFNRKISKAIKRYVRDGDCRADVAEQILQHHAHGVRCRHGTPGIAPEDIRFDGDDVVIGDE